MKAAQQKNHCHCDIAWCQTAFGLGSMAIGGGHGLVAQMNLQGHVVAVINIARLNVGRQGLLSRRCSCGSGDTAKNICSAFVLISFTVVCQSQSFLFQNCVSTDMVCQAAGANDNRTR